MNQDPINPDAMAKQAFDKTRRKLSARLEALQKFLPRLDTLFKKIIFWTTLIVILGSSSYTGLWYWSANKVRLQFLSWTNSYVKQGYAFGQLDIQIEGFPGNVRLRFISPTFAGHLFDTSWLMKAEEMRFVFNPWVPSPVRFDIQDIQFQSETTAAANRRSFAKTSSVSGALSRKEDGTWKLRMESSDLDATGVGYLEPFRLDQMYLSVAAPSQTKRAAWADMEIVLSGASTTPDQKTPHPIEFLLRGQLTRPLQAGALNNTLKDWQKNHGIIHADALQFRWADFSLKAGLEGADIGLNSRLQLQSVFQADIINYQHIIPFLTYLSNTGFITAPEAALTTDHMIASERNVGNMKVLMLDGKFAIDGQALFPLPTFSKGNIIE
jgi:hypothetical protein